MAELIKYRYNFESLYKVAVDIKSVYEAFKVDDFLKMIHGIVWN